jgi:hypothetical protein
LLSSSIIFSPFSPNFEMTREDPARTAEADREARAVEVRYLCRILQALTVARREQAVETILRFS